VSDQRSVISGRAIRSRRTNRQATFVNRRALPRDQVIPAAADFPRSLADRRSPIAEARFAPSPRPRALPAYVQPDPFAAGLIVIPRYLLPGVSFISVDGLRRRTERWRESASFAIADLAQVLLKVVAERSSIGIVSAICGSRVHEHPVNLKIPPSCNDDLPLSVPRKRTIAIGSDRV